MNELAAWSPVIWQAVGAVGFLWSLHILTTKPKPLPPTKAELEAIASSIDTQKIADRVMWGLQQPGITATPFPLAPGCTLTIRAQLTGIIR